MDLTLSTTFVREFSLVLSSDHITPATGKSPTVTISKAGAAFGAAAGAVAEVSGGVYKVSLTAADTGTLGCLGYIITAAACDQVTFFDQVKPASIDANIVAVNSNVTAPVNLALEYDPSSVGYNDGVATAGGASTITLAVGSSATNDYYKWRVLMTTSGTGGNQVRIITGYNGGTRVATVHRAWVTNPDNTTGYVFKDLGDYYNLLVESGVTEQQALSTILATTAGQITVNGTFLNPAGSSTRVAETVDASGFRTAITLTPYAP